MGAGWALWTPRDDLASPFHGEPNKNVLSLVTHSIGNKSISLAEGFLAQGVDFAFDLGGCCV